MKRVLISETEKIASSTSKVSFFMLMCLHRRRYLKTYENITTIQSAWRIYKAKQEVRRRKVANLDINRVKKIKVYLKNYKDKRKLDQSARKIQTSIFKKIQRRREAKELRQKLRELPYVCRSGFMKMQMLKANTN